jgi:transposase
VAEFYSARSATITPLPWSTFAPPFSIDLAKGSFQVCAVCADGAVLYNRVLSRTRMAALLAEQPACVVAMEACATSHH